LTQFLLCGVKIYGFISRSRLGSACASFGPDIENSSHPVYQIFKPRRCLEIYGFNQTWLFGDLPTCWNLGELKTGWFFGPVLGSPRSQQVGISPKSQVLLKPCVHLTTRLAATVTTPPPTLLLLPPPHHPPCCYCHHNHHYHQHYYCYRLFPSTDTTREIAFDIPTLRHRRASWDKLRALLVPSPHQPHTQTGVLYTTFTKPPRTHPPVLNT